MSVSSFLSGIDMKRQNVRFYSVISIFFVLTALLFVSPYFINSWQKKNSQPAFSGSQVEPKYLKKPTVSGLPTHISIPHVGISIDVEKGYYNKSSQTWTLSTTKAEYATVTPFPNDASGNTFIYGHNRREVFYRLLGVKPGDEAVITTANNHKFVYRMSERRDTKPTDTSLFKYQGPPILTLQTCSGLWYQNRSLFVFKLVRVT